MKLLDVRKLDSLMDSELACLNVAEESRRHVVSSLLQTSLRGVDSHGINMFPQYCLAVKAGRVNPMPQISVTRTGATTAVVDADHAFGHHAGAVAMEQAIYMARESGTGAVSVRNSTHFGAAAYFALMAPEQDCLGFAFTNANAIVKAFGARKPFFGTNPICFTAPMESEGPYCLDMATSLVSWNKIINYRRANRKIPIGWAFDREGMIVTDPHSARSLNPAGGYKGFGLGMMVEILCTAVAQELNSEGVKAICAAQSVDSRKHAISHFFMALDLSRFCRPDIFRKIVQSMADRIRLLPPIDDERKPKVAGDPEKESFVRRSRNGIPLDGLKYAELVAMNQNFANAVIL